MRIVSKIVSVMLLGSVFLASCGGVTPIAPVITPSNTLSPTIKPVIPTSTPSAIAISTPTEALPLRADDYQLRPWVADDVYYSKLVEEFGKGFYIGIGSGRQRYDLAFKAETLLRDPSSNLRDVGWQIVVDYPKGIPLPGMRSGEDLLAFLIEDLLNTQNVKPDELLAIIKKKTQVAWWGECDFRAEIVESPSKQGDYLIVKNLFGDNQNGSIFYVGGCQGTAVYAFRKVGNLFLVEKVRDWQALEIPAAGFKLLLDTVGDVNNNGKPEIVIDELFGGSGSPPGRGEKIEFYEWDASKNAFVSDSIKMNEDVCYMYQPCENGWMVEKADPQGFRPIVVNEQYATMYDYSIDATPTCDNYIIKHTYLWKNSKFVEQKYSIIPPTDKRVECQLSWALQALKRNADENTIAAALISKALTDWPDVMNDVWGPASKDYFALRLGLTYDMSGQEEIAMTLIQNVAEHPSGTDYQFASQLAATYLDVRSKQGKVQACREIGLLQAESEDKISGLYAIYVPLDDLKKVWGYGAPIWLYRVDAVCDGKLALKLLIEQAPVSKYKNVDELLTKMGLKPLSVQSIYESNSLTVWLASLPLQFNQFSKDGFAVEKVDYQQLWLLARSSQGFTPDYLDVISQDFGTILSADYLQIKKNDLIIMIQTNDENFQSVFISHIEPDGGIQTLLSDIYVDGFVDHAAEEIAIVSESFYSDQPDVTYYRWDSELQKLDERKINFDFVKAQDEADRLVFQERDFSRAILYINEFLIQAPPEPKVEYSCVYGKCDYYPEWYRPYMRYLLALAYEVSGQLDHARDTYFALWQDYPANIFGLAAEHRLVLVKP